MKLKIVVTQEMGGIWMAVGPVGIRVRATTQERVIGMLLDRLATVWFQCVEPVDEANLTTGQKVIRRALRERYVFDIAPKVVPRKDESPGEPGLKPAVTHCQDRR
jgi:hypothetical protein